MPVCPVCRYQASDSAAACPACGVPFDAPAPDAGQADPRYSPPRRPVWVWLVVGAYVLLAATLTLGPVIVGLVSGDPFGILGTLLYALLLSACGASLVVIPVRAARDLPNTQRSIWLPLVGSATLAMALFGGFALAAHEFTFGGKDKTGEDAAVAAALVALPVVWLGWAVLFGFLTVRLDPERVNSRLYKALLAGSALELLVAIPMHMVVRQRGYCCAGFGTGMGIGLGLLVMLVALGPAVVFLFYRRYRQAYARRPGRPE